MTPAIHDGLGRGSARGTGRAAGVLALLLAAAAIVAGRVRTMHEPLERDIATYAVIGHELRQGRALYSDLWDHKPPLVHLVFAGADLAAGYGERSVLLVNVVAALLTLTGVYAAARWGAQAAGLGPSCAAWAALAWGIASLNQTLEANQPNTEAFINPCLAWMLALFLRHSGRRMPWSAALAVGALAAAATLFKHIAIVAFAALAAAHVGAGMLRRVTVDDEGKGAGEAIARTVRMAAAGAVVALAWGVTIGCFAAGGHLADFNDAVFTFNRGYAGSLARNLALAVLEDGTNVAFFLATVLPSAVVATLHARGAWGARRAAPFHLLAAMAVATLVMVGLPGKGFWHYYQLYLPTAAVAAAWGVGLLRELPGERTRWFPDALAGLAVAWAAAVHAVELRRSPDDWSREKYGDLFVEGRDQALELARLLRPGETFYHYGDDSNLYFHARSSPPTGVFYHIPLLRGPLTEKLARRVAADLEKARPALVVVRPFELARLRATPPDARTDLHRLLLGEYQELPGRGEARAFVLLARKGEGVAEMGRRLAAEAGERRER